ncbi:hypothetical protein HPB49_007555 [Dermacentor silvarum]|uniref:Uncharacterized protein n=1 Tax=Dermacentor silvarum TaxID=543639 RepID=A0ACB8C822_DERSI|nr:hypothetical protein HPB49_007555 [Dermacentor silvarum]
MDPIRVATVGVQADTLDSPILDEEISVGPVSPCHGSLVMDGCETAYLTDNSIEEEVVVVADNASDSLSAIESLDSPGSSSHEMAPSYFLASCGDEEKLTFSHQPTLFLAAQGENSILPLEPGVPLINFNEGCGCLGQAAAHPQPASQVLECPKFLGSSGPAAVSEPKKSASLSLVLRWDVSGSPWY